MKKNCSSCKNLKALEEFPIRNEMPDGRRSKCKDCTNFRKRELRLSNPKKYRERERIYRATESGKMSAARNTKKYRKKNPEKYKARAAVSIAKGNGSLIPNPCESCGSQEIIHAHHDDYAKPLEVRWLCSKCHTDWHKENGEGKNAR